MSGMLIHISTNWRGRPLVSHEVIVELIAATRTRPGLRVRAELDRSSYPLGVKVSGRELAAVPLRRHDWHGGVERHRAAHRRIAHKESAWSGEECCLGAGVVDGAHVEERGIRWADDLVEAPREAPRRWVAVTGLALLSGPGGGARRS
jgi:Rhodopirellula transposase DDE domain